MIPDGDGDGGVVSLLLLLLDGGNRDDVEEDGEWDAGLETPEDGVEDDAAAAGIGNGLSNKPEAFVSSLTDSSFVVNVAVVVVVAAMDAAAAAGVGNAFDAGAAELVANVDNVGVGNDFISSRGALFGEACGDTGVDTAGLDLADEVSFA